MRKISAILEEFPEVMTLAMCGCEPIFIPPFSLMIFLMISHGFSS